MANEKKIMQKGAKIILKYFKKKGIKLEAKYDGASCHLSGDVSYMKQDGALLTVTFSGHGLLLMSIMYDTVQPTGHALSLINDYNQECLFWRAYLDNEDHFLNFDCDIPFVSLKILKKTIDHVISFLADDDTKDTFLELCGLQEG